MVTVGIDIGGRTHVVARCRDRVQSDEASAISSANRSPKTNPSNNELLASRLAPCTPVQETSPTAYRLSTVVWPYVSTITPPMQ